MQMPPFMRNSNAEPLTLTEWQYDLVMEWQRRILAGRSPSRRQPPCRSD